MKFLATEFPVGLTGFRHLVLMKTRVVIACFSILAVSEILGGKENAAMSEHIDYQSWESPNAISGAGAAADSDGDGISNGIEFVIGGDPSGPDSDSNSLLPTVTVDNDVMYFIFRRTDVAGGYNPIVEYSSSLSQWTPAEPGVDGVQIEETQDFYGPGVSRVIVGIPRILASGSTLIARLSVEITP